MKVLLDANAPHGLRSALSGHAVFTTAHMEWDTLKNGELLAAAEEAGFEVLITADRNMTYQQNMSGRSLALLVLSTPSWSRIRPRVEAVAEALGRCTPGSAFHVEI